MRIGGLLTLGPPALTGAGERPLVARLGTAAPFLLGALLTGLVSADHGGYWPTAWGWTTFALVWAAGIALVFGGEAMSRLELAWIGGLVAVTVWTAASLLWTASRTATALELERTLVYVGAATAAAAVVRTAGYRGLVWGVWAGSSAASLYGLATRLLPDRLPSVDVVAGYRLSAPVGYWNGLGLLCAMASVLALGLAAHGRSLAARAAAAASLPLLVPTLYFTFSRGAWIALAAALVVVVTLSSSRLQLISTLLVQSGPAGAALALAYRSKPLRRLDSSAAQTVHAGHRLAMWLVLLALAAAAVTVFYGWVVRSARFPEAARRAYAVLLAGIALAGVGVALVHYGGPISAASQLRKSFTGSSPAQSGDLSKRLFTLSSPARVDQWHVAVREWRAHPVLGSGAGTYAEYWAAARSDRGRVLDAHNLYLEVLAELGPVGLVLLVAALFVPLLAAVRARDRALTATATGAYVAWLVHVAYDWDWELPGVTAAALLCAGAILAAHRGRTRRISAAPTRWALVAIVVVAGVAATLGLLGNRALARSGAAMRNGDFVTAAADARDARRWAPWSAEPWQQLAAVRLAQGKVAAARDAYRQAVVKDPRNWQLWLGLASVSSGAERARAVERLTPLNPAAAALFKRGPS